MLMSPHQTGLTNYTLWAWIKIETPAVLGPKGKTTCQEAREGRRTGRPGGLSARTGATGSRDSGRGAKLEQMFWTGGHIDSIM